MLRSGALVAILLTLAACGDPLAKMTRLSDVDVAENDPTAQALPSEEEVARESFFGTDAATGTADSNAVAVAEPAPPTGFWGMLSRTAPAPETATPNDGIDAALTAAGAETTEQATKEDAPVELVSATPEPAVERRGFFGRLTSKSSSTKPRTGIDAQEVSYGTVLPYGAVARVCEAKNRPMGRKIENASANGYMLFDSKPNSGGARTYYITGFADGCPRQLTAANVLLGEPSFYEQLHYGPAGRDLPIGETDRTYEKIKGQVCGVRKGKPCGAKMNKLERSTFFVNSYQRMEANSQWSELLVHDGAVVASSLKNN